MSTVTVQLPKGRPAYISTDQIRYDERGNWLGREVILVEKTFSKGEAETLQRFLGCLECGGIGEHRSYFVKTGQDGFGTVNGYTKQCTRAEVK